jgi:hypothetical protein
LVFSNEGNTQHIQCANSGLLFTIDTKIIRKRIGAIGKNKSVGPDAISGEILKLGGEAMIPCLARLLDILHVPIVLKSGSLKLLETSGPFQIYNGIALPFYILIIERHV